MATLFVCVQISYARDLQGSGTSLKKLFDRRVQWTERVARRLQSLAFSCTDFDARRRPSMREVKKFSKIPLVNFFLFG